ncbi:MAG: DegV family protein [Coriobacteriales bacterium]|jgi:DegV family protein with EDD domain
MPDRKCNIVIDSCCDLPYEVVESLDVTKLLFPFEMSDGVHLGDFGQSMTNEEFYRRMSEDGEFPKTAQLPLFDLVDTFENIAESGEPTVVLCLSSGLSGTFDTLVNVVNSALERHPNAEIHVVDTLLASIAEGLLILEAVKQRDRGLSAAELAVWAREARYFVHGYFTVGDLKWLREGGRIPPAVASIGAKLDIKPILTFDLKGRLTVNGLSRGRKKSLKSLAKLITGKMTEPSDSQMIFANAQSESDMKELERLCTNEGSNFMETEIGPVIGSHVGPGMVAGTFWGPDRREQNLLGDKIVRSAKK